MTKKLEVPNLALRHVRYHMEDNTKILEKRLEKARKAYYNLDPIISDAEYDALKDQLQLLRPDSPEVTAVGAIPPTTSVWEKVEHEIPMGSLNKVSTVEDFEKWVAKTEATEFLITHKLDGSSLEVVYRNGKMVRCVTRGDGRVGEDVTVNAANIPSIPHELQGDVIVRGEVVMLLETFRKKYVHEYANPRNTANGKIREKKGGGKACADLTFVAYTAVGPSFSTEEEQFIWLEEEGFVVPSYDVGCPELIKVKHEEIMEYRSDIPYEIDGTVIRVNDIVYQDELGELNMRPRGQMAWKPKAETGITDVLDVVWQVGPTGRVSPVCIVNPVRIGGVTIERVSLHNLKMFRELNLWKGCRVTVSRRNDVIPYLENVIDEASPP